jgi:hypothetical protein
MMISFLIISFSLLLSSTIILSDDYLENLSVNTGETATFICDLPEKYSNKHVSSHAIYHLFFFSLSIKKKENKHNKHDYVVISPLGKYRRLE